MFVFHLEMQQQIQTFEKNPEVLLMFHQNMWITSLMETFRWALSSDFSPDLLVLVYCCVTG